MSKEQVMPFLLHEPWPAGHGDWTVRGLKQKWMHWRALILSQRSLA
jgi:hypothetical protein